MQSNRIFITGAAGFIGSTLSKKLLESGNKVIGIDNFDPYYNIKIKQKNIQELEQFEGFEFIEGDIRDKEVLKTFPKFDILIHIAAKAGVRPSLENPGEYMDVNIIGTQNLLELCKEYNCKKFIFASSSSVYGVNPQIPWTEAMNLQPISPYASSKLSCEMLGHVYANLYDIQFLALRFFTVYGPKQRPDLAIHKFVHLILNDQPITLYGDGSTSRDYTFVDDIVDGILGAVHYKKTKFEIINLASNRRISLMDLVQTLEDVIGKKASINYTEEQAGDVRVTYGDISKARNLLGYAPKVELKEGLTRFYQWYTAMES
ncbi:MAG: GDP-mannose 4,6-dehydratase [Bacteroidota bacterium]